MIADTFERDGRKLRLGITDRRGHVWKAKAFLRALKNAESGFDEFKARSLGGSDRIFCSPENLILGMLFGQCWFSLGPTAKSIPSSLKMFARDAALEKPRL